MASVTYSNVTLTNNEYIVQTTNSNGYIRINQPTTNSFYFQYSANITSGFIHNYTAVIRDNKSNITLTLNGSNLSLSCTSSNIFSTSSLYPYLQLGYNTIGMNRYDDCLVVTINSSNIIQLTNSNVLPSAFDNSYIQITALSNTKFKDVVYQSTAVVDNCIDFKKPTKFTSVSASNVSACNIVSLSNQLNNTSNTAYWASNNLLNKNTSGTINGFLDVKSNELRVYPTGDPNAGIRLIGNGVDGNTPSLYNGGLASWWGIGLKCHLDGKTRFLHDTRNGNTYMEGSVGIGKSNPSFKLDILGNARINGFSGAIGLTVSNNTHPGIEINNGTSALNIGVANGSGAYSTDAVTNDTIVRNNGGKLLLQSGGGSSAICINTSNNVGIGTVNPSNKLDVSGVVQSTVTGGANATFVPAQIIKCDASALYSYWRNSNLGFDVSSSSTNLASNKRHIIFNEYADATSGFVGIGTALPAHKLDVAGNVNALSYTGATITSLSNLGLFGSNTAVSASNTAVSASNTAVSASNTAVSASNTAVSASNTAVSASNTAVSASNVSIWTSNALSTTNTAFTNYSNYETGRVNSLSNFAYSIQSSNTTTTIYTSNVITKTVNASDGGTIGSLLMSATGLALGGYNLFNNQGQLIGTIQDSLGKLKLNPSGAVELQSLLGKSAQYTDSVQIGVSTLVMSNNAIYFNDGTLSNMIFTSNAISILNSNITTFTVSNANLYTNCNVFATNITSLSNVSYWASNNLFNKNTGGTVAGTMTITGNTKINNAQIGDVGYGNTWAGFAHSNVFSTGTYALLHNVGGQTLINCATGTDIRFRINNAEQMTMNATGLGIGTTNPSHKLDVAGNVNALSFSGSTITSLSNLGLFSSNTAVWASNNTSNMINRTTDYISNFFTDNLVLQNSLNIIGSGWTWSNGWKAYSQYGGYVLRNGQEGGIQFWTGTSNNGLGYKAVLTSDGNFGIGTGTPTDRLTVAGNVKVLGDGNPGGLVLSNNNSPGISLQISNASTEIGMACFNGAYSYDAVVGDCIIRSTSNLILQTGAGSASLFINSNNRVGINTKTPTYTLHTAGTFFASNITSPTIDTINNASVWTSNLTTSTYYKSEFASNTAVWSSNTARWTSNYTGALSNLGMDALTKAQWSSNNFGVWRGTTAFAMPENSAFLYNNNVSLPFESYALIQYSNGLTEINGSRSNGVIISSHGAIIASFSNNTMEMNGGDISTYGLRAWAETTLKRGSSASAGTYTHFPFTDGKNYIRGTTILGDTSTNEKIGIGTTSPAYKLEVSGTTRLSSLIVGSHTDETKSIRHYSVQIPPSLTNKATFDATGSYPYPDLICVAYAQMRSSAETITDAFAVTVLAITSSNIKFGICRVDSTSGWGQYPWLDFCVVGM